MEMRGSLRPYSIICFICCISAGAYAQIDPSVGAVIDKMVPKPIPTAPNASSLGRFGDYEVNMYTGLPDISIPLFEAKSGALSIPITLKYHASGIRRSDDASWVGLGWSLSTGGQITRKIQGRPDEEHYISNPLTLSLSNCTTYGYLRDAEKDVYDTQPDIFSYSFPGGSGNFFLSKNGQQPYLFPYAPLHFTSFDPADKFEILDDNGALHRFGKSASGITAYDNSSMSSGGSGIGSKRTGWHLMDVVAPNSNDRISLTYQSIGSTTKTDVVDAIVIQDPCTTNCNDCATYTDDYVNSTITSYIETAVSEIFFQGGKLKFVANTSRTDLSGLKALDKIEVYNEMGGVYTKIKSYQFIYSYFSGVSRLKLDELRILDANDIISQKYRFTYYTNSLSFGANGKGIDLWGFANGKANTTLVPQQQILLSGNPVTIGTADRSTDSLYLKQGVLKKIEFPTGGFSEFLFEAHRYSDAGVTHVAGGLRIKRITSSPDGTTIPAVKYYKYGTNESGVGTKTFAYNVNYFRSIQAYKNAYYSGGFNSVQCYKTWTVTTYMSNPLFGTSGYDGTPVVYPTVTEYFGYPSDNIGKIIYEFDNNLYSNEDVIYFIPQSNKSYSNTRHWKRGKLTRKRIFDKNNNLLSKSNIQYELLKDQHVTVGTIVSFDRIWPSGYVPFISPVTPCYNEFNDPTDPDEYDFMHYAQSSGVLKEKVVTDTTYEAGSTTRYVITQKTFSYDANYVQVVAETELSNIGTELVVTRSAYPFSFSFTGSETGGALAVRMLKEKNIRTQAIERYTTRENSDGSNRRIIAGQVTTFKQNVNSPDYIHPDEIHVIESINGLTTFAPATLSASSFNLDPSYKPRLHYSSYDRYGNIEQFKKSDDIPSAILWGYNETLPIAQVHNATVDRSYANLTYFYGTSFSSNLGTDQALSPSLTIEYSQSIPFTIDFFQFSGTPTIPPILDVVVKRSDGTIVYDPGPWEFGSYSTVLNLSPGTYTVWYKGQSNSSSVRFNVTASYFGISSHPRVFHTSFEDSGVQLAAAKTGRRVHSGAYSVKLPSHAGKYLLTWWEKPINPGGTWSLQQQPITVPYGSSTYTIGSSSKYVDEVRLFPEGARMETYTYDPLKGITTSTDVNNSTTYYEYDSIGRLYLIKDTDGKIVRSHQYHYKGFN